MRPWVIHRLDDLEIHLAIRRNMVFIVHRPDDLEINGIGGNTLEEVIHRIDGLATYSTSINV